MTIKEIGENSMTTYTLDDVNINSNEAAILDAAFDAAASNGQDFGFSDEIEMPKGIARKSLSGYMSQLSQKELVCCYDDEPGEPQGMFVLTELGQAFVEARQQAREYVLPDEQIIAAAESQTYTVMAKANEVAWVLALIPFNLDTRTARGSELYCLGKNLAAALTPFPGAQLDPDSYLALRLTGDECRSILSLIPANCVPPSPLGFLRATVEDTIN
jgi:hypothetical protein